jgi:dTDP-4-amino-4,6-dideoxygalactose transaminase
MQIPFNKPFLTGKEIDYIREAVLSGKISGNGMFTRRCHDFFEQRYGFRKCLLTTSGTDALEMCALVIDIRPSDEVIMPSYTFVSTANAFILRGAVIRFCDSATENPNIDPDAIEPLITERTRAIVIVHYAGIACDMEKIMSLASRYHLFLIEDAAQAIDAYYQHKPLGSFGHLAAFSFHETKNIISGEGGMLVINDDRFVKRAEILWEKGTNRTAFYRGEVDKYGWIDIGSSFLPSELTAAFLFAQLENLDAIQQKRKNLWKVYEEELNPLEKNKVVQLPHIPPYATPNAHMFYLLCRSIEERDRLIEYLKQHGIMAVFHYLSLHKSPYYAPKHDGRPLPNCDRYADCLLRLPLFYELTVDEVRRIASLIIQFYSG